MFSGRRQRENWKTVSEASKILRVSKRTIERRVKTGVAPSYCTTTGKRYVWVSEFEQRENRVYESILSLSSSMEETKAKLDLFEDALLLILRKVDETKWSEQ